MSSDYSTQTAIIAHQICFNFDHKPLFGPLSFCLSNKKTALIGANGSGKTTLANILAGFEESTQGRVEVHARIGLSDQLIAHDLNMTIGQYLGVEAILHAQARLANGEYEESSFELASKNWHLPQQLHQLFEQWQLSLDLERPLHTLSSGEQTKAGLIKLQLMDVDYYILDEPTNHLDLQSKQLFKQWLHACKQGVLLITHDRYLLDEVTCVLELRQQQIFEYGDYEAYLTFKSLEESSKQQRYHAYQQSLQKLSTQAKRAQNALNTRKKIGKHRKHAEIQARGCASKMVYNNCRNQSEKTQARLQRQVQNKLKETQTAIEEVKAQLEQVKSLNIDFSPIHLHAQKKVMTIENLSFGYQKPLIRNLNWQGTGPFRVAILGDNGAGKSTLIKLLTQQLRPDEGRAQIHVSYKMIDQSRQILNHEFSILEQFNRLNPQCDHQRAHSILAEFGFEDKTQTIQELSGGEIMRLQLAIAMSHRLPPECLILDEPNTHMDFSSLNTLEQALNQYRGALLVVSHDPIFLKRIGIEGMLVLSG